MTMKNQKIKYVNNVNTTLKIYYYYLIPTNKKEVLHCMY